MEVRSERLTAEFLQITTEELNFLETEYGFELKSAGTINSDYFPDAEARVTYVGNGVGVKVAWYFAGAFIGVALAEAPQGIFPDEVYYIGNRHPAGVDVYSLVRVLYPNASTKFILQGDATSFRHIKKREKLIRADMRGVVRNVAFMLRTYASEVLRGDTSCFSEIHAAQGNTRE